jgi:hypothetical protein
MPTKAQVRPHVHLSPEALSFSRQAGIATDLSLALDAVTKHFSIIGSPVVNLIRDPEIDDLSSLAIEIQVAGSVKDNVRAHREFAAEMARLLGPKRELITLHYSIT